jgi:hypothetical protein
MVVSSIRTVTAICPAVRTFREHFLFVVADTWETLSGHGHQNSGQRPRSQKAISPTPIGQDRRRGDAHVVGYYARVAGVRAGK